MRPSDSFFKLMEAAQERGIGQCVNKLWNRQPDDDGIGPSNVPRSPVSMCVVGLETWGEKFGFLNYQEFHVMRNALPHDRVDLNNLQGWTFADFYEYLKDKEEADDKKKVEIAAPCSGSAEEPKGVQV